MAERRNLERVAGLGLAVILVAAVVVIYTSFRGGYSDNYTVTATVTTAGDALAPGDIVTYRAIIVGEVASAVGDQHGGASLRLKIAPAYAKVIPASVLATTVPISLFGAASVNLAEPLTATPSQPVGYLHDGSLVAPDTTKAAQSLQAALSSVYTLLTAVHPAQLDAALTAFATALQGQGQTIGTLIDRADSYLTSLMPQLPQFDTVLSGLATATNEVAKNAPSLLGSIANLVVVGKGINADQQAVTNLLSVAPTALQNASTLLSPNNVHNIITLINEAVAPLAAVAAQPDALSRTVSGFKSFADVFSSVLSSGVGAVNLVISGVDAERIVNLGLGQPSTVLTQISTAPDKDGVTYVQPYTNANCPSYGGISGPNCSAASGQSAGQTQLDGSGQLIESGGNYTGAAGPSGTPGEQASALQVASAMAGLPESETDGPLADLILAPMLRGSATVIR